MEEMSFAIQKEESGKRLDAFLKEAIDDASRNFLQGLISQGAVLVNDKTAKANYKVKENDMIFITMPDPVDVEIKPQKMDLDIVYEDEDVLVVNKPAGLVVHPAHGHYDDTLVNGLLAHCKDLSGINGVMRPGIVHRIDKDTSGLLMVAKNDFAHNSLAEQLKVHSVERGYIALVQGVIAEPAGVVDAPIGRHPLERKKMAVNLSGKEARTNYFVKERFDKYTLIECRLETGRTHQIRVHLSYIGHPLVGDELYGSRKNNLGFAGQALHAYLLGFIHPRSGAKLHFEAPLPEEFRKELELLRSK